MIISRTNTVLIAMIIALVLVSELYIAYQKNISVAETEEPCKDCETLVISFEAIY